MLLNEAVQQIMPARVLYALCLAKKRAIIFVVPKETPSRIKPSYTDERIRHFFRFTGVGQSDAL
jgi:hypothetical protein